MDSPAWLLPPSQAHGQAGEAKGFPKHKHKHSLHAPPCVLYGGRTRRTERDGEGEEEGHADGVYLVSLCLRACTTDNSTDRVMETPTTSPIVFSFDRRRIVMTIIVLLCYCSFCGSRSCVFVCVRATPFPLSLFRLVNYAISVVLLLLPLFSVQVFVFGVFSFHWENDAGGGELGLAWSGLV